MKYRIKSDNKEFVKVLDEVENMTEKEMDDLEDKMVGTGVEARSAELYGILSEKVAGEAMMQVRSTKEGDGLMAWRDCTSTSIRRPCPGRS